MKYSLLLSSSPGIPNYIDMTERFEIKVALKLDSFKLVFLCRYIDGGSRLEFDILYSTSMKFL